jgi:hypothetical protein
MSLMGVGSAFSSPARLKTTIYKYTTPAGKTIITDTLPSHITGTIEIIN